MRVGDLKKDIEGRFAQVDERFAQVDARFAQVDARFAQVDARFAQVDARFVELQQQIAAEGAATRRHMDMLAEQFRSEVRLTLDKVMAVGEKTDLLDVSCEQEHSTMHLALDDHEVRLKIVEDRR